MKKDKKYKIDYKNCMKRKCDNCKYKQYCFKGEKNSEIQNKQ